MSVPASKTTTAPTAPTVEVTFKGGSLGGETRAMPLQQVNQGWTIQVPVMSAPSVAVGSGTNPLPATSFTQETYVVRPGAQGYEAMWQNPNVAIEEKLAETQRENGRLERMVERLVGLFEDDDERLQLLGWLASEEATTEIDGAAEPV